MNRYNTHELEDFIDVTPGYLRSSKSDVIAAILMVVVIALLAVAAILA